MNSQFVLKIESCLVNKSTSVHHCVIEAVRHKNSLEKKESYQLDVYAFPFSIAKTVSPLPMPKSRNELDSFCINALRK